jgi:hypothetical protein
MANGLFGLGGFGGMSPAMPQQLQGMIDPAEMRLHKHGTGIAARRTGGTTDGR